MSASWTVASCSATFGAFTHEPVERLEAAGCSVRVNPYGRPLTKPELVEFADGADVIILGNDKLSAAAMKCLPNLRLVVRHGAGVDNIDLGYARRQGIVVANTPGANKQETADLTFGLILDLERSLTESIVEMKQGVWQKHPGHSLFGKTIGIIGVGAIGMCVASRAMGFGMDILGFDIVQNDDAARYGLLYTSLNNLLEKSDVITLHTPLTLSTRNLIGAKEFHRMKSSAILVNTSRSGIVREGALEKALLSKELYGYATDVYDVEPPKPLPIYDLPNVLVTPHIGSATYETNLRMGMAVADNILAYLGGNVPPNVVVPLDEVRYS